MTRPGPPPKRPYRAARAGRGLLAALVGFLLVLAGIVVGAVPAAAQNRVGASSPGAANTVGSPVGISAGQRLGKGPPQPRIVVATAVAAETGGAASVRLGQAGEAAVRGAYDIGPKATAEIGGRTRIFDGLNGEAVSEVKNVARQSLTQQLRDDIAYARDNGLRFDLYVRPSTELSGPLTAADLDPLNPLNIRYIP